MLCSITPLTGGNASCRWAPAVCEPSVVVEDLATVPSASGPSGRLLARNTLWNLAGQCVPLFIGLITMPLLVRGLGTERFAVLTFAWLIVGYFSLFDLGLGRALTQMVAEREAADTNHQVTTLVWTALADRK